MKWNHLPPVRICSYRTVPCGGDQLPDCCTVKTHLPLARQVIQINHLLTNGYLITIFISMVAIEEHYKLWPPVGRQTNNPSKAKGPSCAL